MVQPAIAAGPSPNQTIDKLSEAQERRLITFVENRFALLDRLYEERNDPDAKLPTLLTYLDFIFSLHSIIIQTPPSSTPMRFSFFLRLTIDVFDRCTTYPLARHPAGQTSSNTSDLDLQGRKDVIEQLLQYFALLDEAWIAILTLRPWDARSHRPASRLASTNSEAQSQSYPLPDEISDTMRTILHSTLTSGEAIIDEWLLSQDASISADVRERFGECFWGTLELLEGAEEGVDMGPDLEIRQGVDEAELEFEDKEMEKVDLGMFHGFDEL